MTMEGAIKMKYKYVKGHANYDLTLGKEYDGFKFKEGWILIKYDDKGKQVLYREECFKQREMWCDICNQIVEPLDAHFGRLKGKLTTAHIDCWNKEIKNQ